MLPPLLLPADVDLPGLRMECRKGSALTMNLETDPPVTTVDPAADEREEQR
jgi:hypothetical protein